ESLALKAQVATLDEGPLLKFHRTLTIGIQLCFNRLTSRSMIFTVPTGRVIATDSVIPTDSVIATDSVIVASSGYVVPAAYDINPGTCRSQP
ncbi:hypothetical protein Tco_1536677, partial [Tanacetum coccineum]